MSVNLKNSLRELIKPKFVSEFDARFEKLQPIFDEVYNFPFDYVKQQVLIGGGAAAYLIGRFNSFNDCDFFISFRQPSVEDDNDVVDALRNLVEIMKKAPYSFIQLGKKSWFRLLL